jgi:hypothetical protein
MATNIGTAYLGTLFAELSRRGSVVSFVHPMAVPSALIPGIPAHF